MLHSGKNIERNATYHVVEMTQSELVQRSQYGAHGVTAVLRSNDSARRDESLDDIMTRHRSSHEKTYRPAICTGAERH
jgi:hypothetical protein